MKRWLATEIGELEIDRMSLYLTEETSISIKKYARGLNVSETYFLDMIITPENINKAKLYLKNNYPKLKAGLRFGDNKKSKYIRIAVINKQLLKVSSQEMDESCSDIIEGLIRDEEIFNSVKDKFCSSVGK